MPTRVPHRCLNAVLVAAAVALVMACGDDPEVPPAGSVEEKLCGEWVSDPIPHPGAADGTVTVGINVSFWTSGLHLSYPDVRFLDDAEKASRYEDRKHAFHFTVAGSSATSGQSNDDSAWVLRADTTQPGVLYGTWTLRNGGRHLNQVRFLRVKP